MPTKSKRQFRFFKMLEKRSDIRKEKGLDPKTVKEMTKDNKGSKSYKNLPEKK